MKIFGEGKKELFAYFAYFIYLILRILYILRILSCALRDYELKVVLDGTVSVYDDIGWYMVSISWYCLVLGLQGQQRACMSVYIGKSGDWVGCY